MSMLRAVLIVFLFVGAGTGLFLLHEYYQNLDALTANDPAAALAKYQTLFYVFAATVLASMVLVISMVVLVAHFKKAAHAYAYHLIREMSATQDLLRKFYEFSPVPYIVIEPNGKIRRPNKAALRLFGKDEAALLNAQLFDWLQDPEHPQGLAMFKNQVSRGVALEQRELQAVKADGSYRWVLFYAEPMVGGLHKELTVLVSLVDIHEQKELERIKTEFLSLASHQLRAPLANLKWSIDFLLTRRAAELTDGVKQYLLQMFKRNDEMIDLVNTLLNLSRIEMGRVKVDKADADLTAVAQSVLEEMQPAISEKQLVLDATIADGVVLRTDGKLLRIVLQNLVTNAVRYTPTGGSVSVILARDGQGARFTVKDSGIGIPPEEQGRIFQKMYRATNAREVEANGNGIGLYMCKALTEALGGSISFTSEVGNGTTFTVQVPA